MIKTIPNFIRNVPVIMEHIHQHNHLFKPRTSQDAHEGFIPNLHSRFQTLYHNDMSSTLIDSIFAESDFSSEDRDLYSFIQIQYYDVGDYIVPHSDLYAITKLHLVVLTDSICDGFCGVVDGCVYKVQDQAGTYIDFDSSCVHWVGPVCNKRWSLVIGV